MPTHGPGHLRVFDYTGLYRYFLTFCCHSRQRHFTNLAAVDLAIAQVLRAATDQQFAVLAYCLMPDHAHLLIEAQSESSDGRRFIARAKQLSGYHYKQQFKRDLWQRCGYEHVLRDDEDTIRVAQYILENPVRAGLVSLARDYPFIGSSVYTVDELLEGTSG